MTNLNKQKIDRWISIIKERKDPYFIKFRKEDEVKGETKGEDYLLMKHISEKYKKCYISYLNSDRSSWVILCREFETCSSLEFEEIWSQHPKISQIVNIYGKMIKTPRYTVNYGQDYSYSGNTIKGNSFEEYKDVTKLMNQVNEISASSGLNYNYKMCLVNLYEPEHYIGAHSDDEKQLVPNSPIFSLSIGESRLFRIKSREKSKEASKEASKETTKERLDILLNSGDLLIMGGTTQKTHKHELPKSKKNVGRRINYTLRCFE